MLTALYNRVFSICVYQSVYLPSVNIATADQPMGQSGNLGTLTFSPRECSLVDLPFPSVFSGFHAIAMPVGRSPHEIGNVPGSYRSGIFLRYAETIQNHYLEGSIFMERTVIKLDLCATFLAPHP